MSEVTVRIEKVVGRAIEPYIPDLAKLRIEVFREYPYLYDGSLDYEAKYLTAYAKSARSVFVLAMNEEEVVGVSTGLPMVEADEDFQKPFLENGYDLERVFYFGESVLRKSFRGSGVGSQFMKEREAHARSLGGFEWCTFCSVQRDAADPRRPADYRDLRVFWRKYGFVEKPELETCFGWKEIGGEQETLKRLRFWLKPIEPDSGS